MADLIFNIIGVTGAIMIAAAYFLLEKGRFTSNDLSYSLINGVGSSLAIVSLLHDWNLASFVINSAWVLISIYGIVRVRSKRN